MKEMQAYAKQYHKDMNWEIHNDNYERTRASLLNNYMLLTTEMAEVAEEFRRAFNMANKSIQEGMDEDKAFELAKEAVKEDLGKEFADCLAYITKMANYFEIDLEDSFYNKMNEVKNRKNKDVRLMPK
ncbi:MazG nucleotide pyrophosphohydrolase domain-containing protein [Evansella sp. AB-P1]|uniref:MazG nucleotide pyrophosphohydrolase domain-containing protein n=1 Tax=Evansella sp. AB-P1 TaxID=3037653 RepID=UPI00241EC3BC|nr:MazG nucleotide pyrophosphohydrolase domain-containing protein [Evansella sp. AB-P1]MDG5789754.1 MazG nucleotide pyrophosphohydrolase domain-containing protein [Evansella sp. AB-P1]